MIDLQDVRSRPEAYQEACDKKRIAFSVREFLTLDEQYRKVKQNVERLRATQNTVSKEIPKLSGDTKASKLAEMKELAATLRDLEGSYRELEQSWQRAQLKLPSIPHARVPLGKDDSENVEIRVWGTPRSFPFPPKDHVTLGLELGILDIERGVKVSGARNYFLKGDGARLHHAVLNCAMDMLHHRGYTLMEPPHLVKYFAMEGTSYFPGGEDQAYRLDERDPDLYLIGTSEVPVCSYHADEIFTLEELPKRYAGYSPCYRREAGTYGRDTQGVYRIHQFYKVEQVVFCEADTKVSETFHAELLGNAETLLQALGLAYRVVDVCTGDMGQGQVYKNDIETWMPSRQAYGETHSCSTFHDFQSRRLGVRYKDSEGKNVYCHTLNNTFVASPRILIPLLEVYQESDGSVVIPEVLRSYMGGQERIVRPRQLGR